MKKKKTFSSIELGQNWFTGASKDFKIALKNFEKFMGQYDEVWIIIIKKIASIFQFGLIFRDTGKNRLHCEHIC